MGNSLESQHRYKFIGKVINRRRSMVKEGTPTIKLDFNNLNRYEVYYTMITFSPGDNNLRSWYDIKDDEPLLHGKNFKIRPSVVLGKLDNDTLLVVPMSSKIQKYKNNDYFGAYVLGNNIGTASGAILLENAKVITNAQLLNRIGELSHYDKIKFEMYLETLKTAYNDRWMQYVNRLVNDVMHVKLLNQSKIKTGTQHLLYNYFGNNGAYNGKLYYLDDNDEGYTLRKIVSDNKLIGKFVKAELELMQPQDQKQLVTEELLNEANRYQLLNKSKNADNYKNTSKGKNRYHRRNKSRISTNVAQYNQINMDEFFKQDILTVGVKVQGETNNYVVTMKFSGALNEIQRSIKSHGNNKLEFRDIVTSLTRMFNTGDVYIGCSCPDQQYRIQYWNTQNGYNADKPESRPSNITNPNDTKGAGCKHIMLVLANLNWLMKVASVINNYIKYCEEHMERNYADYIFPKLYGMPYNKAVQMGLFDTDILDSDEATIDLSNEIGRDRGKFRKDRIVNNQKQFPKKEKTPQEDEIDLTFDNSKNESELEQDIEQDQE